MSKKFLFITFFLSISWLLFQYFLTWVPWLFGGFLDLVILGLLMTSISRLLRSASLSFSASLLRNSLIFWSISGFLSIGVLIFSLWHNTYPGSLSKIVLSDGDRTIVFLEMSHIATPRFYETIHRDIRSLVGSGYIAYVEWVAPGKKENQDQFDTMLGIKLNTGTYTTMANIIGMVAQNNSLFSWIKKEAIKNVDISIDDIVSLTASWKTLSQIHTSAPVDIEAELASFSSLTHNQVFSYIVRSIMNFSLKNNDSLDLIASGIDPDLMDTILTKRNSHVVNDFLKGKDQKVIFLYGGLHFQWMYELLKARNPKWKILSIEPRYPYVP